MNLVILAAGYGSRLAENSSTPKGLITIRKRRIVEDSIETILGVVGIEKIVIVTNERFRNEYSGFFTDRFKDSEKRIDIVVNTSVHRGNGYSFYLAKDAISTDKFILIMSDHYFSESFVRKAIQGEGLAVDADPIYVDLNDATKVMTDSQGYVRDIGKNLPKFNYIDTGFFILDRSIFRIASIIEEKQSKIGLSDIIREARIGTIDVTRNLWIDIDTFEDLQYARKHVQDR